jgi:uncharacterized protein YggE
MKLSRWMMALALLAGVTAGAQPRAIPEPRPSINPAVRLLRVEGKGEAKAEPDEAWLDLAVETSGSTAKVAGEENARKMERILAALTGAGIPRKEIDTRNYSVYPEYTQPGPSTEAKLRGYRVNNTVSVHVRELPRLGELIDRGLAAGANRVDGVRFALSKEEAVHAEALRQAVERARKTAEVLAAALGVRLGAVLDASTVFEPPHIFSPARMAMMEAGDKSSAPTTPILPEEQTIEAQVTLIFAIEGPR